MGQIQIFVVFLQEPGQDCLYEMADKDEPKPGSIENWEKFVGKSDNTFATGTRAFLNTVLTGPARFFREKIVEPNQAPEYPYYHRRFRRVPTIDECYLNDYVCQTEANDQFIRDKQVEAAIMNILSNRVTDCIQFNLSGLDRDDPNNACQEVKDTFRKAQRNFYIKYGDLPVWAGAKEAFFKQKHRMVWERRHGPNTMEAKRERLAGINAESSDGE